MSLNRLRLFITALGMIGVGGNSLAQAATGTYAPLYAFTGGGDGAEPWAPLTPDGLGGFYTTAENGGIYCSADTYYGCGVIVHVDADGRLTTLHSFAGGDDGFSPETGVTAGGGVLFGTAFSGLGTSPLGVVYSINPDGSDYTVLHVFDGQDGNSPVGKLVYSKMGGVFGITQHGGKNYSSPQMGKGIIPSTQVDGLAAA